MSDKDNIVEIEREGEIGFICLAKPPVNALGVALRTATFKALQELSTDDTIKAIVLYGQGRFFSAGADIKDFGRAGEKPTLPDLLKALNDCEKPTIAAMHGIAFGGALELALSTHFRVGIKGLKVALPEVKLGLLPGAGGTQRLTRLTGLAAALDIVSSGREVLSDEALALGIINQLTDGDAKQAGFQAAKDILSGKLTAKPTDGLSVKSDPDALKQVRAKFENKHPRLNAPLRAIDAVEAALLPIDEGLAQERKLFMELMQGDERAGLVHAFFAERATAKIPEKDAGRLDIKSIGIVGGGTMGVGIASAFATAGYPVCLIEMDETRVETARSGIEKNLGGALKRGKLSQENHTKAIETLICKSELSALADVDLVIEAIFEDMDAKTGLFQKLDDICKDSAVLATNTSYLDVNLIASATSRPQNVIGLHFFSPAHIMRLMEVVVADKTSADIVATCFDLAKTLRKIPVRSGVCDGFIGNRILTQYRKASEYLVLDGAGFDEVDTALEAFGFAMGPFAVSDLAGLDIARATRKRKAATRPAEERYSRIADLICDEGWYGRKTGQGFYTYESGKKISANQGAKDIVIQDRERLGISPQNFTADDIVACCLTAMIMEATNALQEGVALRPVDIDAVELFGYGFPRHRGGPMHMADQIGLETIISRIEIYAKDDDYFWKVPELMRDMVREGQSFAAMNQARADGGKA